MQKWQNGAADKAGIEEKNIITEFDGKRVRSIEALVDMLQYYEPGEIEVTLQVLGNGGYEERKPSLLMREPPRTLRFLIQQRSRHRKKASWMSLETAQRMKKLIMSFLVTSGK